MQNLSKPIDYNNLIYYFNPYHAKSLYSVNFLISCLSQ